MPDEIKKHELPQADTLPYFKTGKSSPDSWMEKTKQILLKLGAQYISEFFGAMNGRSAYCLQFEIGDDRFRVVWPVLPVKDPRDEMAARIQAATMLYHECKARALTAAVLGPRVAFFPALLTPTGKTLSELTLPDLSKSLPRIGFEESEGGDGE